MADEMKRPIINISGTGTTNPWWAKQLWLDMLSQHSQTSNRSPAVTDYANERPLCLAGLLASSNPSWADDSDLSGMCIKCGPSVGADVDQRPISPRAETS